MKRFLKNIKWMLPVMLFFTAGLLAGPVAAAEIIKIDGSSTVYPIVEAVAEEFQLKNRKARVMVGISGTGGGFKKFCNGEIDITDASRPIKPSEVAMCKKNGEGYIELPVAYDGLTIVVHKKNTWVHSITVAELKKIWEPAAQRKIMRWNQVRTGWPDKEIHLFGPGVDSGSYDYFTLAVVGKEHASRGDFTASEDDNVLVQGISTDPLALGFFGLAYYEENKDKLKLIAVDDGKDENGKGPIKPTYKTVGDGTYQPLSRPIFIYVRRAAADKPQIRAFIEFFLTEGRPLVQEVGFIALPDQVYDLALQRFRKKVTGSIFGGKGSQVGVSLEKLLKLSIGDEKD